MIQIRTAGRVLVPAVLLASLLAACASAPKPTDQIAASRAAIDVAQNAGAQQYAPVELQSARQKLESAELASKVDDNERARRLAEAALADAQLAQARAAAARSGLAVNQVDDSLRTLRSEMQKEQMQEQTQGSSSGTSRSTQ